MHHRRLDFEQVKPLLLDLARERSLAALLDRIPASLARQPAVALARIWLVRPGDICPHCPRREDCPGNVDCLHLVASGGTPVEEGADWSRLDGAFRRFPLGIRKVGQVGASGEPLLVEGLMDRSSGIVRPEWAKAEGIVAFAGQPLLHRDEILGVLGVFLRRRLGEEGMESLRLLADHAAAAIANARAFAEIDRLRGQLELENEYLKEDVSALHGFGEIVGVSASLRRTLEQVELVAPTEATVLILGESGTGKELVARAIHDKSRRADRPLIRVNCAAIPRELFESEFFGHVRGAFTGAMRDRQGRFAAADGGTLLLDEVGEIPLVLQGKLLRVLQEGQYERVGEERTRSVDARIVAATNRDLARQVERGDFRQDLYYRLNVFPIEIEPLRHRREDIPVLARHYLEICCRQVGAKRAPRLGAAHIAELQHYSWPGNVRELQNVLHRAVITAVRGRLSLDLPQPAATTSPEPVTETGSAPQADRGYFSEHEMRQRERENLVAALEASQWKVYGVDGAADRLGLKPTTLASRMKKLGIRRPPREGG